MKVGLEMGGASNTGMCRRFYFGGEERSRADSSQFQLYSQAFTDRTIHRVEVVSDPAQLADTLNKKNQLSALFS